MSRTLVVGKGLGRDFHDGNAGRITVLRDVDCEIAAGARIALVGPSGSGKTTLLHILGGLDRPTTGTIEWPGLGPFEELLAVLARPFEERPEFAAYAKPPSEEDRQNYRTY